MTPPRLVVLGASNVMQALPTVIMTAHRQWGRPLDLQAAIGHGRGYGSRSLVLGRRLEPILKSALWEELAHLPPANAAAVVTDIGNDLVYGADVEDVARWVRQAVERLRPHVNQLTLTELPLVSLNTLGPRRYNLCRRLLFPSSRMTLETALQRAAALNQRIVSLAEEFDARLIVPCGSWYGYDPIHIRRRHHCEAWQAILPSNSNHESGDAPQHANVAVSSWIRFARPHERWLFGIRQTKQQPAAKLLDGSRFSFY